MINNADINKIVGSNNKLSFGKQDFNISSVTKIMKKLDIYANFFQKWDILIRLNACILMIKDGNSLDKYMTIYDNGKKLAI